MDARGGECSGSKKEKMERVEGSSGPSIYVVPTSDCTVTARESVPYTVPLGIESSRKCVGRGGTNYFPSGKTRFLVLINTLQSLRAGGFFEAPSRKKEGCSKHFMAGQRKKPL